MRVTFRRIGRMFGQGLVALTMLLSCILLPLQSRDFVAAAVATTHPTCDTTSVHNYVDVKPQPREDTIDLNPVLKKISSSSKVGKVVRVLGNVDGSWHTRDGDLFLTHVIFCGGVDLSHMRVEENFLVQDAYFERSVEGQADLTWITVKRRFTVADAVFANGADFTGTRIGSKAKFCNSRFEGETDFNRIRVDTDLILGTGTLRKGHCKEDFFEGPVDFGDAQIVNKFDAQGAHFVGRVNFDGMRVGKAAKFDPNYFNAAIISFGTMAYGDFWVTRHSPGPDDYRNILHFVGRATYSRDTYATLESYFRRVYPPLVDDAFIQGRRAERDTYRTCAWRGPWASVQATPWTTPWDCAVWGLNALFLENLVGYGRHTYWIFVLSGVLIVLGWLVFFRREGFWYSFALFLPGEVSGGQVQPTTGWARSYRLIGWLLLLIGAAYLTGFVGGK